MSDINPQVRIRELIERSSSDDVCFVLNFPEKGELASDVAEFLGFPESELEALRESGGGAFADLGDRESEFVFDIASLLVGHFLGSSYCWLYEVQSWRALQGISVEAYDAQARQSELLTADIEAMTDEIASVVKRHAAQYPRNLQFEDIMGIVDSFIKQLDAAKFSSKLQASFLRAQANRIVRSGGTCPPSPSGGRPPIWVQHDILIDQLLRLAKRQDVRITKPRAASPLPQNKFHELLSHLVDDLELAVNFKTLARRAFAKANHEPPPSESG